MIDPQKAFCYSPICQRMLATASNRKPIGRISNKRTTWMKKGPSIKIKMICSSFMLHADALARPAAAL